MIILFAKFPVSCESYVTAKTPLYSKNSKSVKQTKNGPWSKFILRFKMY